MEVFVIGNLWRDNWQTKATSPTHSTIRPENIPSMVAAIVVELCVLPVGGIMTIMWHVVQFS